ncbi:SRPBCC family protein [Hypericibacter sp.]|uniref:SRPBCC family protein n=1 Tax=Hypericibacter sp. TaxID=2705401 RepID=UPI003D6D5D91
MEMTGEYRITAPREAVWRALNDPDVLKQCIPGCEEIVKLSDTEMTAKVVTKVGPVSARFSGKVTLSDLDPPNGYKITGEGTGGAVGFAKGGADVKLTPDETGQGTVLSYTVNAAVGGKIAQIGARLIDGTARKLADEFFGKFSALVSAQAPAAALATLQSEPVPSAPKTQPGALPPSPPTRKGLHPVVWIGGLVVVVLGLLIYFGR